jgi:membrane-associated phospholipid phosphatase
LAARPAAPLIERIAIGASLALLFVGGYFTLGHRVDSARATELMTAWDRAIPFVPWMIFVYIAVFPVAFLPVFLARSRRLLRRTWVAIALAMVISYGFFYVWPVTSINLRVDAATLDPKKFTDWCVLSIYRLDPPFNLFPSLHLSVAALSASAVWRANRRYGAVALAAVALISISICAVKQHFIADGLAGLALAASLYRLLIARFEPDQAQEELAYRWPAAALYLIVHALVYLGFYLTYRW